MPAGTGLGQSAAGGMSPSELARLEYLETNEYKITYWASITTDSGSITKPTGSTIVLDALSAGVDAVVETISNGQPTGFSPVTGGGAYVTVSSFDTSGNYTLSGTPSATPVALLYVITIPADQYQNLDLSKIIMPEYNNPVVQTINNGDTSHAPSSDAVYDALATKQNTLTNPVTGTGTSNEIAYWSASNTIGSLAVATYPNLTELSYVKGLTGALQTQLNSKGYTLIGGTSAITPADSTTYFFGGVQSQSLLSSEGVTTKMPIPKTGTIKSVQLSFINSGATTESSTMLLRLNATTDYTISTTTDMSSSLVANYALSIPVTQGDTFCFKWTTPAWATNPANLRFHIVVYIE